MYHQHQSATDSNQQQHFGPRGCGGPGFKGKFGAKFGGRAHWMKNYFANMNGNRPAVNIEETDSTYTLHVYAAGLLKENFSVTVKDQVLTISYKAPENVADEAQFAHREFTEGSFERLFQLSDKVLTDDIQAAYSDGVLKVTLPKSPEAAKPAQKVSVN